MSIQELRILVGGEAGQGVATVGHILAKSLVRAGYYIVVTQSYQSRIRGGHNTFAARAAVDEVTAPAEGADVLAAFNAETVDLHRGDLSAEGVLIAAADFAPKDGRVLAAPLKDFTSTRYINVAAAGVVAAVAGLDEGLVEKVVREAFGKKEEDAKANREALAAAFKWAGQQQVAAGLKLEPAVGAPPRLMLDGNEALALGAISAGVKFCAFYPMTPSTSIPLTLIKYAGPIGLTVEQAEDEIAAVNMACGASFAGAPSMVATSGGGFALMVEGVSLAGMTETPVVVMVGQRPGPATGLPTRTEQADLNFVLHAGHGEFPRALLAPGDAGECFHLARQAFYLAQRFQTPVFILTDQFLADSYRAVEPFDVAALPAVGAYVPPASFDRPYRRYADAPDGVSPRLLPGFAEDLVVADSDEHTADGHLTEDLAVRKVMVEKRLRKSKGLREAVVAPVYEGPSKPDLLLVSWGSTLGSAKEACATLRARGRARAATLHFSQVWPLRPEDFLPRLEAAKEVAVVESNAGGQFAGLLRRETGFDAPRRIGRYDGLPITPAYILRELGEG